MDLLVRIGSDISRGELDQAAEYFTPQRVATFISEVYRDDPKTQAHGNLGFMVATRFFLKNDEPKRAIAALKDLVQAFPMSQEEVLTDDLAILFIELEKMIDAYFASLSVEQVYKDDLGDLLTSLRTAAKSLNSELVARLVGE